MCISSHFFKVHDVTKAKNAVIQLIIPLIFISFSDLEPEWLDDIQKNGELFYLELSEGEEEAAVSQANAAATNHVRFSETEAEIISEQNKKRQRGPGARNEPTLKRFVRMLRRRKRRSSQRREGGKDKPSSSSPPPSILKNQPGQRSGVTVQQQRLKDVCVYLNPKRLGSAPRKPETGGLLEALLGVVHRASWDSGPAASAGGGKEERLTVQGLIPNSPAVRCGRILIGEDTIHHICLTIVTLCFFFNKTKTLAAYFPGEATDSSASPTNRSPAT